MLDNRNIDLNGVHWSGAVIIYGINAGWMERSDWMEIKVCFNGMVYIDRKVGLDKIVGSDEILWHWNGLFG